MVPVLQGEVTNLPPTHWAKAFWTQATSPASHWESAVSVAKLAFCFWAALPSAALPAGGALGDLFTGAAGEGAVLEDPLVGDGDGAAGAGAGAGAPFPPELAGTGAFGF